MTWNILNEPDQIEYIIKESFETPCLIFKHSTTCPISSAAKMRIDDALAELGEQSKLFYLDLLAFRSISNLIAEKLKVHHESPQVILIKNGDVVYDESHLDITSSELLAQIA